MDLSNIPQLQPSDFGPEPLPEWVRADTRWQKQMGRVDEIYEAFKEVDVVFLQAPTGVGKTLIGELSSRLLGGKALHVSSTKQLQDQFTRDFPYAKAIKGKANYLTQSGIMGEMGEPKRNLPSAITCSDCTFTIDDGCNWCVGSSVCPYNIARNKADLARMASLNYAYFIKEANLGRGRFASRRLVVADEADLIEKELLRQYEVVISPRRQATLGLFQPSTYYGGKTTSKVWMKWLESEALPTITEYLDTLPDPHDTRDIKLLREIKGTVELHGKLLVLRDELKHEGWVYDGYSKQPKASDPIIFRPVRVDRWAKDMLWPHGEKFLLMSATILSADIMADELGLDKSWQLIDVPSDFPIEHRPIHVVNVADMSFKERARTGDGNWEIMARGIEGVAKLHPGERILVHCVSYDLARYLYSELSVPGHNLVTHSSSNGKQQALKDYASHPASILLAVGMDRGVDLPDDLCRVQIVAKIPFPNIEDKVVKSRMWGEGGRVWYKLQTIRTLIQMTGRGVRSSEDWCVTYILDSQMMLNLWSANYLFPLWWKEAVDWKINRTRLGV